MKFLVDGMLGGLARWLRILGQDVRYETSAGDNELLQIAENENMILLTRDTELSERAEARKLSSLLVVGDTEKERMAQVARAFRVRLDIRMAMTRCPECGSSLNEASKAELAGKVPETSLRLYNKFWICADCGKPYWLGSHWKQIRQTLDDVRKIVAMSKSADHLSNDDGKALVEIARQAIMDYLDSKKVSPSRGRGVQLSLSQGVFVTLTDSEKAGELRGCIGNPFPKASLVEETTHCAIEAATMDPRFDPITRDEFSRRIAVEVTVVSPPETVTVKSRLDLPLNIRVGRDGLMVSAGRSRGLLLPQVAVDEGFDEEEFLSQCCMKAGLTPDAWMTGKVRVARFQGQIFSEEKPCGPVFERKLDRTRYRP